MSDLLALRDYDSQEFVDRIGGLYRHFNHLGRRIAEIAEQTDRRIAGIKWHLFKCCAEMGEALLRVQEAKPGEFGDWFQAHREALGFSPSTADRAKAYAAAVREHGLERAYVLACNKVTERPAAYLSQRLQMRKPPEDYTPDEARALVARMQPLIEALRTLERIAASQVPQNQPGETSGLTFAAAA